MTRERLEFELTASEYAANQLASLREDLADNNYSVIEEAALQLSGAGAYERVHTFAAPGSETSVMQMQVYLVKGGEAIVITCTNTAELFESTKQTFREAVKQFRWRSAQA
jgi:hypothetical protein